MSNAKIREEFEAANDHRAWFVYGGRTDSGPEGYVYDDFTTDMCWTCWVDSRAKLVIELPYVHCYPANEASSDQDYYIDEAKADMRHQCKKSIESAGLKVKP